VEPHKDYSLVVQPHKDAVVKETPVDVDPDEYVGTAAHWWPWLVKHELPRNVSKDSGQPMLQCPRWLHHVGQRLTVLHAIGGTTWGSYEAERIRALDRDVAALADNQRAVCAAYRMGGTDAAIAVLLEASGGE